MKLTDIQLVLLSAASQRDDRAVMLPANLKGGAAHKMVTKLLAEGLVEEICARGALPVWRRDEDEGALALRITRRGLKAIPVEDMTDAKTTDAGEGHAGRTKPSPTRRKTQSSKPGRGKKSQKNSIRKPARCQRMIVSGRTIATPPRTEGNQRYSQTNRKRSKLLRCGCFGSPGWLGASRGHLPKTLCAAQWLSNAVDTHHQFRKCKREAP